MGAVERDEFLRAAWKVMVAEQVEAKRLVFVDEMGTSSSLFRNLEFRLLCTHGHREERAYWSVPRNRGPNTTLEHERGRDGAFSSRGGYDHRRGV
jgi:hypothetical protein